MNIKKYETIHEIFVGPTSRFAHPEKFNLNFLSSSFVIRVNQSSPSLTVVVSLWFIIIPLVFFCLSQLLL